MKFPLIIAHGENVIFTLLSLGVGTSLVGLGSVVVGFAKQKESRSVIGIVMGSIASLAGIGFFGIHRFRPPYFDLLMLALTAPLLLGVLGLLLSLRSEKRAEPGARAHGRKQPWLILNVRQKMKSVADPKKYIAGWCIIALALATSVVGFVRDNTGALSGGILVAIFGLGFTGEAVVKKEVPPHLPWVRWYHLAIVTLVVGAIVSWLWLNVLK